MPQQGIFYVDPPPPQQGPHAPILRQGNAPPFIGRSLAQTMAVVLAAWPTGMEPGLPQPDRQRSLVAPLTYTYGQQPPRYDAYQQTRQRVILGTWEPPPPQPQRDPKNIVPLTLRYGDFPPPPTGMMDEDVVTGIARTWLPPDPQPQRDPAQFAPLTQTYGNAPPVVSGERDARLFMPVAVTAWQPPDPQPTIPQRQYIVPLTLRYGQQPPPPTGMLDEDVIVGIVRAWQPSDPPPQQYRYVVQLPPVQVPYVVSWQQIVLSAWQPTDPQPQRYANVAPLTLAYGNQPPQLRQRQVEFASAWQPADLLPTLPRYVVPAQPPVQTAYDRTIQQRIILSAWDEAPQTPRERKGIAPLTLTYGQQPPLIDNYQRTRQRIILGSWEPPPPMPTVPQRQYVVPLTLVYGQQPPIRTHRQMMALIAANEIAPPAPWLTQRVKFVPATPAQTGSYTLLLLLSESGTYV